MARTVSPSLCPSLLLSEEESSLRAGAENMGSGRTGTNTQQHCSEDAPPQDARLDEGVSAATDASSSAGTSARRPGRQILDGGRERGTTFINRDSSSF